MLGLELPAAAAEGVPVARAGPHEMLTTTDVARRTVLWRRRDKVVYGRESSVSRRELYTGARLRVMMVVSLFWPSDSMRVILNSW